ncbi:unnamed protein product [Rhodiola kirilowii]
MSQRSVEREGEERGSVLGDNMQEQRQGLPPVNQRLPPPRNQQFVNEFARHRAARHENSDDYEDELDRQYLGGGNQYGQLARRRDLGRTMRGVCVPFIDEEPWCIRLDEDADDIEIKSGVIHHLPKFGRMPDETPLRHLKEFHGVCMSMKSASVPENIFKLKTFTFSLESQAKSWLMSLPSGSITSWDQLQRKFMDKYYSHSKVAQTRKELSMLRQGRAEMLFDYLERFTHLEESCPNHGIPQRMLLEYFMDGMVLMERRMLDASAQGSILDMYPDEIWELIGRVAESTRYLEETYKPAPVTNVNVHSELQELKDMMAKMMTQQPQRNQQVECKVNKSTFNSINNDNAVFQERTEDVNIVDYINKGDFPPRRYDGYQGNNKWQPRQSDGGWQRNNNYDAGQSSYPQKQPYKPPQIRQGDEDPIREFRDEVRGMFKELTQKMGHHAGDINKLKRQMSQIASAVYEQREDKGKLPSQMIPNPRQNVSVIVIKDEEEMKAEGNKMEQNLDATSVQNADVSTIKVIESHEAINNEIQQKGNEDTRTKAQMQELEQGKQGALTTRTRDPGAFTVTCGNGNTLIPHCLIDLGASINVMPYDLYCSLKLRPVKPIKLTIELGNKACVHPYGLLENLTVNVGEIVVPTDFYVLQMEDTQTKESPTLILGRPILFAMKAEIDVAKGIIKLKYGGKVAEFRVFEDDHQPCAGKPPEVAGKTYFNITTDESLRVIQGLSEQLKVTRKPRPPDKKRVKKQKCGVGAQKWWTPKEKNWRSKPPDGGLSIEKRLTRGSAEERSTLSSKFDLEQPWDPNL